MNDLDNFDSGIRVWAAPAHPNCIHFHVRNPGSEAAKRSHPLHPAMPALRFPEKHNITTNFATEI
jgi:hypothetical protein